MPKTSPARIWSAAYRIRDVSGLSLFILRISARTRFLPSNVLNPRKLTYHEPSPQGEINAQVASRVGLDGDAASRTKLPSFERSLVLTSSGRGVQSQTRWISFPPLSCLSFSSCWRLFCLSSSRPHFCHPRNEKDCGTIFCEGGSGSFDP